MGKNINQIATAATSILATDKLYLGRSPFGATDDRYILGSSIIAQVAPLTTKGDLYSFSTLNVRLPVAVGNGKILQVSSGAATGLAYSTPTYPSASGSVGQLLRADGTNNVYTTSTYPDTVGVSTILYASSANIIGTIAAAQNGVLVSNNTNVPSMLAGPAATGRVLTSNAAAAPSWSTSTFPSTGGAAGNILISDGTNYIASTSLWPNTVGTALHLLISNGTSNVYSTPAYPNASVTAGKFIISDGTNYIASTSIMPNTVGASGKILISDGTSNVYSTPTYPNASVTAGKVIISDGTNYIASTSIFPNTVGTAGKIIRSDGTVNAYTTSTFADTYTASNLLYSNGANTVTGLATGASGVLVTDVSGVPSISSTLPAFTTSSITFNPTTGGIVGTTTNNNAAAGKVGEFISSTVTSGAPVSMTSPTAKTVTSISLTAGDWDVSAFVGTVLGAGTILSAIVVGISLADNTLGAETANQILYNPLTANNAPTLSAPLTRMSLGSTTTIYMVSTCVFSVNTCSTFGLLSARRIR